MKKYRLAIIVLFLLAAISIYGISKSELPFSGEKTEPSCPDTTLVNPKVDIKVNKEYDENGNVIRYDSSYTYIYTYPDGRTEPLNMDSIFNGFRPYFFNKGFDLMQKPFHQFFDIDSTFQQHFFDQDYFMQQFEKEIFRFEDMMREMDSLRNYYLKEIYTEMKQKMDSIPKTNTRTIQI